MNMKKIKLLFLFLFPLICTVTSFHNTVCPFDYMFHFGDGVTDIGNSVLIPTGEGKLPPTLPPYGMTYPGKPNARWSDGRIDFDWSGPRFGFPVILPYLAWKPKSTNAVIFSVARSPVLGRSFFVSKGINIPSFAVPLDGQMAWFKAHLASICSTQKGCSDILGNSLILTGDIEANDIGYALSQGKSIEEVQTYLPLITNAQIDFVKELVKLGAKTIVIPGSSPIGCYPYILTARSTNDSTAYDKLGCLKDVNNLITAKNNALRKAVEDLAEKYRPNVMLYYSAFDDGVRTILRQIKRGPHGETALQACCGVGGKYNYDSQRCCSSAGVSACSNPNHYMFWDGLHVTQKAAYRIVELLIDDALKSLNCKLSQQPSPPSSSFAAM